VDLNLDSITVTNNEEAQRFEAQVDGLRALLTYRRFPDRIVFNHIEVPPPVEKQGPRAKLTRTALDFARANHFRVRAAVPITLPAFIEGMLNIRISFPPMT